MKNTIKAFVLLAILSGGTAVLGKENTFKINQGREQNSNSNSKPYMIHINQVNAGQCDAKTTASFSVGCSVDYSKALRGSPLLTISRENKSCVINVAKDVNAIEIGTCFHGPIISEGNIDLQP